MERAMRTATFGKSMLGLSVVDVNGDHLSLAHAFLRTFAKGISFGIGSLASYFFAITREVGPGIFTNSALWNPALDSQSIYSLPE